MAVVGTVHPDQVLANRGARPGDRLVLTKPIGLGVISTGVKRGHDGAAALLDTAIRVMTTLNEGARDAVLAVGLGADAAVHAGTDVTGFGFLGHLREVVAASGVGATVDAAAVPVIDGVRALIADGMVAGGTLRNHAFVSDSVDWGSLPMPEQHLLADAQTSGGLLLACAPEAVDDLVAALEQRDALAAAVVGTVTDDPAGRITIA
jgi:selenide,water dikinase